mgnify:CR=1 FL=1
MPGPTETRVTKISKLKDMKISGESCLVMIAGPFLGKKYPLIDEDEFTVGRDAILRRNLKRMSDRLREAGVMLRPHLKTAKSIQVGRMAVQYLKKQDKKPA